MSDATIFWAIMLLAAMGYALRQFLSQAGGLLGSEGAKNFLADVIKKFLGK